MNNVPVCPEHEKLRQFLLGETSDQDTDLLEQHLHECQRCQETLHGMQASDTLVEALRAQRDASSPPSDVPDEQLTRLIQLRESASAEDSASAAQATPAPQAADAATYAFLAPPQQSDELGRLGPYRVLAVLGAGGMGVVFKAEDPQLGRLVALKAMLPSISNNPAARQRFLREARAAAAIKHDHIVVIHQVGEDRGAAYLAMEFLEGQPLDDRLKDKTSGKPISLPLAEVLRIGREIAQGLEAAHERGLVHRDIKPANVWLEGKRARVKILDFGLARAADADEQLTRDGAIVGTPAYMAPEQARGEHIDARCDLFSLGCILYRMCTGLPPFKGADAVSTLMAVAMNEPAPPAAVNAAVPASLSALTMRLLAKNPAERPESGEAVAVALAEIEQSVAAERPAVLRESTSAVSSTQPELRTQAAGGAKKPPTRVMLAAAAGFLFVCMGVWVIVRDKAGKEMARVQVPDGGKAEFTADAGPGPLPDGRGPSTQHERPSVTPLPAAGEGPGVRGRTPASAPPPASPFDSLRREAIDPYELKVAGGGDAAKAPAQLVGVYGDSRLAMGANILGMAMFPDDQTIAAMASANNHTYMSVWDRLSGRRITSRALPNYGTGVEVSRDGTLLACFGQPFVKVWEYPLMREYRNLDGFNDVIRAFRLSADNRWGAGVGQSGKLYVWDVKANRLVHQEAVPASAKMDLAFHPDGTALVVVIDSTEPKDIVRWELPSCKPLPPLTGHVGRVVAAVFSPDGKSLYSIDTSRTLMRWDWATGKSHTLVSEKGPEFDGLAVDPDGKTLATCDVKGEIVLWEAASGVKQRTLKTNYSLPGGNSSRTHLQFARQGRFLISSNPMLTTVGIWQLVDGEPASIDGHREAMRQLAVTPDGKQLVTNSTAGTARVWSIATGKVERSFTTAIPNRWPLNMALSPDGGTLAVAGPGRVGLWNLADGADLRNFEFRGAGYGYARHLLFSADGKSLGIRDIDLNIWDLRTGELRKFDAPNSGNRNGWAFSADGQTAYVGTHGGPMVSKLRTSDWSVVQDWTADKSVKAGTPTLSADGKLLVMHESNPTLVLDTDSGKVLIQLPMADYVAAAPQGQRFAGVWLNKYWLWDRASGLQEFAFPEDVILGQPVFSPDGRHLLTSNLNGTVYALRLPERSSAATPLLPSGEGGRRPDEPTLTTNTPRLPHPGPLPAGEGAKADDAWIKQVAALTPARQLDAVSKKLQELNPGFDGKLTGADGKETPKVARGQVIELGLVTGRLSDLSPLRALPALVEIGCYVSPNTSGLIDDLSPLAGLKLSKLRIPRNKIVDLSPLAGMPLASLDVSGNKQLLDLSPLAGMPLVTLDLNNTRVFDLSPLKGMPLTSLICFGTLVSDLSPVQGMPLTKILFGGAKITDLSPLKGMALKELDLAGMKNVDLSPLAGMQLERLSLHEMNRTVGWSQLKLFTVAKLDITYNKSFSDLSLLSEMPLTELNASATSIADLSPLAGKKLTILLLGDTRVSDLTPLRGMPLWSLNISKAPVSDLAPLQGMQLDTLYATGTKIADLSPLRGMPLPLFAINDTLVSDFTPLRGMRSTTLNCSNTKLSDLSQFEDWNKLKSLNLKGCPVTAERVGKLQAVLPNCKIEWDEPAKATPPQPAAAGAGK